MLKVSLILLLIVLSVLVCFACVNTSRTVTTGPVPVLDTFSGMYDFGFDPLNEESGIAIQPEPLVIRDNEGYQAFINGIPETQMTKISPAPPSDDPLLKRPEIDFEKQMMLVIFSHDPNRFVDLEIVGIELNKARMRVFTSYVHPHPDEIVSKVISFGFYYAVVIDRFDGEVEFR